MQLHGNNALDLAGNAMDGKPLSIIGGGGDSLNITGVVLTESAGGVSVGSDIDISHLATDLEFLVNGSRPTRSLRPGITWTMRTHTWRASAAPSFGVTTRT